MAARSGRGHHRGAAAWRTAWSWHSGCLQNERRQEYVSHFEVPCRAQDCPALQQLGAQPVLEIWTIHRLLKRYGLAGQRPYQPRGTPYPALAAQRYYRRVHTLVVRHAEWSSTILEA